MTTTSLTYPLNSPVILDTLAYERKDRSQCTDPEPHQYVGNVVGTATMYNDGWPVILYIVRLCSPDRFEDPKRANGMHISNLLVDESCILADARKSALD